MELQYAGLAHSVQTAVIAALIFAACAFLPKLNYKAQVAKLPVFGGPKSGEKQRQTFLNSAKKIYISGYEKVRMHRSIELTTTHFSTVQRLRLPPCCV